MIKNIKQNVSHVGIGYSSSYELSWVWVEFELSVSYVWAKIELQFLAFFGIKSSKYSVPVSSRPSCQAEF